MTVYVIRDGELVEKGTFIRSEFLSPLPAPFVSRPISFESPVTGREITSHRERDRDMKAAGACDPRDLGRDFTFRRGREAQKEEARTNGAGKSD